MYLKIKKNLKIFSRIFSKFNFLFFRIFTSAADAVIRKVFVKIVCKARFRRVYEGVVSSTGEHDDAPGDVKFRLGARVAEERRGDRDRDGPHDQADATCVLARPVHAGFDEVHGGEQPVHAHDGQEHDGGVIVEMFQHCFAFVVLTFNSRQISDLYEIV